MSRPENRMHTEKSAVCILFFGSVEVYSAGTVIPGARKERCNDKPYDILLGIHYGKRKATAVMSSDVCCCFCGVKGKHVYSTFRPFGMDRNAENGNTT